MTIYLGKDINLEGRKNIQSMEEEIYLKIKQDIMSQDLGFGNKLNESELAKKYGVSRMPIRNALKKLSYDGLVEIEPNKGATVMQPTIKEALQIINMSVLLEKEAVKIATTNITSDELIYMKSLLDKEIQLYKERNLEAFIKVNHEIHMCIANASQNKFLIQFIDIIRSKCDIYLTFFDTFNIKPITEVRSFTEHFQVYKAMKERNVTLAMELYEEHITRSFEPLLKDGIFTIPYKIK